MWDCGADRAGLWRIVRDRAAHWSEPSRALFRIGARGGGSSCVLVGTAMGHKRGRLSAGSLVTSEVENYASTLNVLYISRCMYHAISRSPRRTVAQMVGNEQMCSSMGTESSRYIDR